MTELRVECFSVITICVHCDQDKNSKHRLRAECSRFFAHLWQLHMHSLQVILLKELPCSFLRNIQYRHEKAQFRMVSYDGLISLHFAKVFFLILHINDAERYINVSFAVWLVLITRRPPCMCMAGMIIKMILIIIRIISIIMTIMMIKIVWWWWWWS